jgi:hypothetical protein
MAMTGWSRRRGAGVRAASRPNETKTLSGGRWKIVGSANFPMTSTSVIDQARAITPTPPAGRQRVDEVQAPSLIRKVAHGLARRVLCEQLERGRLGDRAPPDGPATRAHQQACFT